MINILATPHRARAIDLADLILQHLPADQTFGGHFSMTDVHAAHAEMVLRAGRCVAEVDRLQHQMAEDAKDFIRLTEEFIANHPLTLGGAQ